MSVGQRATEPDDPDDAMARGSVEGRVIVQWPLLRSAVPGLSAIADPPPVAHRGARPWSTTDDRDHPRDVRAVQSVSTAEAGRPLRRCRGGCSGRSWLVGVCPGSTVERVRLCETSWVFVVPGTKMFLDRVKRPVTPSLQRAKPAGLRTVSACGEGGIAKQPAG
jgi:hypothetical protein